MLQFHGVVWEPNFGKLAIHTQAKRAVEAGKKDYTLDAKRDGVDIYEMIEDPIKGFIYKLIGFLPSEKVTKFSWAGCGDVFVTYENEGKNPSANFYMIAKQQQDTASQPSGPQKKGAAGSIGSNKLQSSEEKYEFKKTGRQEIYERKFDDAWDQSGRYVAVFGIRTSTLDKADKSLRFFNIFGEQLAAFSGLAQF